MMVQADLRAVCWSSVRARLTMRVASKEGDPREGRDGRAGREL